MELDCRHNGCGDKVKRSQLDKHEKCCSHRPDCNFCNETLHETSHKVTVLHGLRIMRPDEYLSYEIEAILIMIVKC